LADTVCSTQSINLQELLKTLPKNVAILDSYSKAYSILCTHKYKKVLCSVSGGADSDLILDICARLDIDKIIDYVWFDTGVEFNATKEHLKYLESRYNITIRRERQKTSVPLACK
jgi:3'-phosphoadenosine 5'-phosphosulfate sulfotransferase (PAPS reductase)/FAD synthetase